jgi:hypothetical protein
MVVRMWHSTTAETSRAAARQPLPSSQTRQSTARARGSRAKEIAKGNSPAMVLAMFPPQIVNCWSGVTWVMNRNRQAPQAASSGAGSRRRRIRNEAQQVTGSRSRPSTVTSLNATWSPRGRVSAAMSTYGSGK